MKTERLRVHPHARTVGRDDESLLRDAEGLLRGFGRLAQHRARLGARHQGPVGEVTPVGERLSHGAQPECARFAQLRGAGETDQNQ